MWLTAYTQMKALTGAVKFCFGETGRDLIREAELIDRVMLAGRHPNIVSLTDCHLDGDAPWLMFEYVPGGTLTDWIHRAAGMTPADRLAAVRDGLAQLAAGVAFFHALDPWLTHRDLKPSNVLYDPATRHFRITDFGIGTVTAKLNLKQGASTPTTSGVHGFTFARGSHTPIYASPQQKVDGDPDRRDDVHALGVIGYQMMTGHLLHGPVPDYADDLRAAGADEELVALLGRCMAHNPDRRPADAGVILAALSRLAAPPLVLLTPPVPAANLARKAGDRLDLELPGGGKMAFAWCPPGTFKMGGTQFEDEKPVHEVTLTKGFYMGVYPVTQAEWQAVMGNDPSHFKGPKRSVESVSWDNARAFCLELSGHAGRAVRLPTEAEWKYACRAGTSSEYWWGDVPKTSRMNYRGDEVWNGSVKGSNRKHTIDVGALAGNPWGLFDTHGNMWEWCGDYWDGKFYQTSAKVNPVNNKQCNGRALRSGSWDSSPQDCRSCHRSWNSPEAVSPRGGFRVCFCLD